MRKVYATGYYIWHSVFIWYLISYILIKRITLIISALKIRLNFLKCYRNAQCNQKDFFIFLSSFLYIFNWENATMLIKKIGDIWIDMFYCAVEKLLPYLTLSIFHLSKCRFWPTVVQCSDDGIYLNSILRSSRA